MNLAEQMIYMIQNGTKQQCRDYARAVKAKDTETTQRIYTDTLNSH